MVSTASHRVSRLIALCLLLVSVWTAAHRQQDDDACLPMLAGEHDASKHAAAPAAATDHDHCAICHWIRGLKPAFTNSRIASAALRQTGSLATPALPIHFAPSSGRLPARAPPAGLL